MFNTRHLSSRDIQKIEEALNSDDLEFMVAIVDEIVTRKLARAARKRPIGTKPRSANEDWFQKKFYQFDGTNREQILSDMRVKLATLPEDEREICGWYAEGIANEYDRRD